MKIRRNDGIFEGPRRRRRLPIFPIALGIVLVALVVLLWQRGGEQAQVRVEKAIPAEKLGQ